MIQDCQMEYEECPPPPSLDGLVKAFWSLRAGDHPRAWLEYVATPDGSVEIVCRDRGESTWHRPQPKAFAAGLTTCPARLCLRGDATFRAVRLWPWTWHMLGGTRCGDFLDDWILLLVGSTPGKIADKLGDDGAVGRLIRDAVVSVQHSAAIRTVGLAILQSSSVAEIVERTGLAPRSLQRWARVYIGMPLRTYLRLLRFQHALADVQHCSATLAESALLSGYADQPHMARSFRELAGEPAVRARARAVGPFLKRSSAAIGGDE